MFWTHRSTMMDAWEYRSEASSVMGDNGFTGSDMNPLAASDPSVPQAYIWGTTVNIQACYTAFKCVHIIEMIVML